MRNWLSVIGLAVAAILFALPAQAQPVLLSGRNDSACREQEKAYTPIQQRYERGLIFRVEKCGYTPSTVMGTMHSDSSRLAAVYEDALGHIQSSQAAGFEFVEDEQTAATAQQYMLLPSSYAQGLRDMIPAEEYSKLATALETRIGFPPQVVNRMRPWAAAVTLQYPVPTADGVTLDVRLQQQAAARQKKLFGLETPAEQFRIFDNVPFDKQVAMLRDTIRDMDSIDASNAAFMEAYTNRDLEELHRLAEESFAMTEDAWLREYLREHLLIGRNHTMARRMQPHLRAGNTFIAVGALHLLGDEGVLPLLEKQGWRIYVAD